MDAEHFVSNHHHVTTNNDVGHKEPLSPVPVVGVSITKEQATDQATTNSTQKSVIILLVIFVTSLASMIYIYMMFPELEE